MMRQQSDGLVHQKGCTGLKNLGNTVSHNGVTI